MDKKGLTARALAVLDRIEYMTLATVTADGRPWNTPVMFARAGAAFFWTSKRDAQHSANIREKGSVFIVVFDSTAKDESGRGVYVSADASEVTDRDAVKDALTRIYKRRGTAPPSVASFVEPAQHRVYRATARMAWTNLLHDTSEVPWDERVEIELGA